LNKNVLKEEEFSTLKTEVTISTGLIVN